MKVIELPEKTNPLTEKFLDAGEEFAVKNMDNIAGWVFVAIKKDKSISYCWRGECLSLVGAMAVTNNEILKEG